MRFLLQCDSKPDPYLRKKSLTAAVVAFCVLMLLYSVTLAPDITWWDNGEFVAAAHTLGIPHPPGVPLYILLANLSSRIFGWLGAAASVNILSALSTATACALGASIIARRTHSTMCAFVASVCAGTVSTVWLNATEAEVYATGLLLAVLMLWSALKAGESRDERWFLLTAYLFALAAPLHITALIAAPAAIVCASWRAESNRFDVSAALLLAGALFLSFGAGKANVLLIGVGVSLLAATFLPGKGTSRLLVRSRKTQLVFSGALLVVVGLSAILFMLFRAAHDPAVNQGNPASAQALFDVLARKQYEVSPLLPREAPLWLQIGNFFQYLDWQFALGLAPTSLPSVPRTVVALLYVSLAVFGVWQLGTLSRRLQATLITLLACSSLGVVFYLNLKAGPTIGYGILPDSAPHEVRERDYFFLISFWSIGLSAGAGAVGVASRIAAGRTAALMALLPAAFLVLLNFPAANRRSEPDASLPLTFARALLETAPRDAVLFVAGDNDTYPLWYLQTAHSTRRDVTVVTIPLVGAAWYRAELQRRHALISGDHRAWSNVGTTLNEVAHNAMNQGRPVVVAVTVPADERELIARDWKLIGFAYQFVNDGSAVGLNPPGSAQIDTLLVVAAASKSERGVAERVRPAVDPIASQMARFLDCPHNVLAWLRGISDPELLASTCNFR